MAMHAAKNSGKNELGGRNPDRRVPWNLSDLGRIGCKMSWPVHPPTGLLRAHPKGTSFGAYFPAFLRE
jgi:hypothetical protein